MNLCGEKTHIPYDKRLGKTLCGRQTRGLRLQGLQRVRDGDPSVCGKCRQRMGFARMLSRVRTEPSPGRQYLFKFVFE